MIREKSFLTSHRTRVIRLIVLISLILLLSMACQTATSETPNQATRAYQTEEARAMQEALETKSAELTEANFRTPVTETLVPTKPTYTPSLTFTNTLPPPTATNTAIPNTPTNTPIPPTPSDTPLPTLTPIPCNWMDFIDDVSIPDNTTMNPGQVFTKTWRIKNVGTCEWGPDYSLVFISGVAMEGATVVRVGAVVYPGESIDLSVDLVSPSSAGTYASIWGMRTADGTSFGYGETNSGTLDVQIRVIPGMDDDNPFDFVHNYQAAWWYSSVQDLPVPSNGVDTVNGSVFLDPAPMLEGGYQDNEVAIVTSPDNSNNGKVTGKYPPIEIENGDHFFTLVGCMDAYPDCSAIVSVQYREEDGDTGTLLEWEETHDGDWTRVNIDLSTFADQKIELYLVVKHNGNSFHDVIFWLAPTIRR